MATSKYVVKVGDKFASDSGRLVSEYPDAGAAGTWTRAVALAKKAGCGSPGAVVEIWQDYGMRDEKVVGRMCLWVEDDRCEPGKPRAPSLG